MFERGAFWIEEEYPSGYYRLGITQELMHWWQKMEGVQITVFSKEVAVKFLLPILKRKKKIYEEKRHWPEEELLTSLLSKEQQNFENYLEHLDREVEELSKIGFHN
ncbi:hypothetical protein A3D72_01255 [Candidatus Uhrbacteria bacterium RIFCSPHIGHO2_02_FULL_57_19]|uniref:Uncharacterized protein n=1 Tax=Candidatus Uhrbacteria bacterium RIFCSPHIGHO2_02_FULL_57_19 TaxID=1802391 RepID=A0A1F7U3V3_9BACT|nr:MAG: hypothetical protein A3D72_01255 [Candidatus Uhrbacteria bacterium RIFCSPHIGHO2_02_FULL_57_19]